MVKSNNADAFRVQFDMMTFSGVWPKENPNIYYRLKHVLTWFAGIALSTTMTMETISSLKDFARLSEILYIWATVSVYIVKLCAFSYYKKTFLNMIDFLKDPIFASYPVDVDHYLAKTIKISTILARTYRYLVLCCCIMFAFYPILDNKPLPFPFPYDLGTYTPLMYIFQVTCATSCAYANSCLDTLCTSLMGIAAAQLDILAEKIIGVKDNYADVENLESSEEVDRTTVKILKQCVEHHLAIVKLVDYIENVFTMGIFAQFIASVIVICNTIFHFVLIPISSQFFMLTDYLCILLMQLFIYCWYGNEITVKSLKLKDACYMSNWQFAGSSVRKYIFIIMEQSKKPLEITTMKLAVLSLTTFASMLQWTYSSLTLLLNVYQKNSPKPI